MKNLMDMKKYFFLLASLLLAAACARNAGTKTGTGELSLSLGYDGKDYVEIPTRSQDQVDVSAFSIVIRNSSGDITASWDKYADMPSSVTLSPGEYTVEAMTPQSVPAAFDQPVYKGSSQFVIEPGKLTTAEVVCSLDNVKVTVNLGESFTDEVTDYTVTVRGVDYDKSLVFTEEVISSGRAGYFNVSPLEVHIIGKRVLDGSAVNDLRMIEDVRSRDHIILNINARATGDVSSLTITIDYGTNDRNEDIEVPGFPEDPVDGGGSTEEGKPQISFSCPEDVTFTDSQAAEAVVDVTVSAEEGVQDLFVEIQSSTLLGLLGELGLGDAVASGKWNIADIQDPALAEFLGGLGLYNADDPVRGKKEHTFSIGAFMALMPAQADPYPFLIKVTDAKGAEASRTLTVHRTE